MKYAVQYAYISWSNTVIPTDTNPISYEEAVDLFNGHLEDFKKRLKEGEKPQLCIWKDVGDGKFPKYHETLVDLDWRDDLEYENGRFYKNVKSEIELPTL